MGELGLFYRLAPIVFMGGSLVEHGGQNPIEAIKLGTAIVHGPHVFNFTDVYDALDGCRRRETGRDREALVKQIGAMAGGSCARQASVDAAGARGRSTGRRADRTLAALGRICCSCG